METLEPLVQLELLVWMVIQEPRVQPAMQGSMEIQEPQELQELPVWMVTLVLPELQA